MRFLKRRERVFIPPRPFEGVAAIDDLAVQVARLAAAADHLLGAPIVWLEIVVSHAPILHGEVFGKPCGSVFFSQMCPQSKEGRKKSPRRAVPVFARATHSRTGEKRPVLPHGYCRVAHRVPV